MKVKMRLQIFSQWLALQVEINNSRAISKRALLASGEAIDRGSLEQQSWHLLRTSLRMSNRADFLEAIQNSPIYHDEKGHKP